jgi:hypothetical protein
LIAMDNMFSQMLVTALHWVGGWILARIGWGGVVASAAALILILALSARAIRAITSRRGMAITAGVLIAGLAVLWFSWPKSAPAAPVELASAAPAAEATPPPPEAEPEPTPEPEVEAVKTEPVELAQVRQMSKRPEPNPMFGMPGMMAVPVETIPILPMQPATPVHIPSVPKAKQTAPRVTASKPGHSTAVIHSGVAAMPGRPMGTTGQAAVNQQAGNAGGHLTPAQQARNARAMANQAAFHQQMQAMEHHMNAMNGMHPGAMGPMHMGGMHPGAMGPMHTGGMQPGMGHMPAGGMGHTGGHR